LVGAAGQVAYHLMEAAGTTAAPWWVTAVVAALPVATLGMAAALHHLIAKDSHTEEAGIADLVPIVAPLDAPRGATTTSICNDLAAVTNCRPRHQKSGVDDWADAYVVLRITQRLPGGPYP
jgi:hypothetical protein